MSITRTEHRIGASDVSADPRREPTGFPGATHITLVVIERMAHMPNFADTRTRQWARFLRWIDGELPCTTS